MNHVKKSLLLLFTLAGLASCKESSIQIQNNISQVSISDVYWGDFHLADQLYPGQSSDELILQCAHHDFPFDEPIRFIMSSGNKSIYLETKAKYYLDCDDALQIILTDDTEIINPNN